MPKLTEEQIQYIKEHPIESPYGMADKLGCSSQTIYFYLHRFHEGKFLKNRKELEKRRAIVRNLYPTHTASEIAVMIGASKSYVNRMAKNIGVCHNEETKERIRKENIACMLRPDATKKRIDILKRTIRLEQFRVLSGMKQKTKLRFKQVAHKSLCARQYLRRRYNYFYDKEYGELLTLFYDGETKRLPEEREKHYTDVYHIKFLQADE